MDRSPERTTLVVDASVAVKWVIDDEAYIAEARALLVDGFREEIRLAAPHMLLTEVTNAVYQRFRRRELTEEAVDRLVALLWAYPIDLLSPPDLTRWSYRFVRRHRLANVYDSHYVVLARELGTELWTGDRRMFNSLQPVAPWVRWLGDYGSESDDG
jgi:predicted nucleic acid-binding protein